MSGWRTSYATHATMLTGGRDKQAAMKRFVTGFAFGVLVFGLAIPWRGKTSK
jgi:hypothetical protein